MSSTVSYSNSINDSVMERYKSFFQIPRRGKESIITVGKNIPVSGMPIIISFGFEGIKKDGSKFPMKIWVKAYDLDYGPCIDFETIVSTPFGEQFKEHPYRGIELDYDSGNIMNGDYIDSTPAIKQMIKDLIDSNMRKLYTKSIIQEGDIKPEQVKSTIVDKTLNFLTIRGWETSEEKILKVRVHCLNLVNGMIAVKISTNVPHDTYFDIHPFRYIKGSNEKKLVRITGIIPNTPAIQQIIKDLIQDEKFKLYTTYDTDYRSKLIATLYDFFIRDSNKVSECKVIYKFIKNICLHWS